MFNIIDKIALLLYTIIIPLVVAIQLEIDNWPGVMVHGELRFWFVLKEFFKIMFGG